MNQRQFQHHLLGKILGRIHMNDLPALAGNIEEIRSLAQDSHANTARLTATFLKDLALVCKILRTVNSAFYQRSKPLGTISAAVNSLGIEEVTALASNTMILEKCLKAGIEQDQAFAQLTLAMTSGVFAQKICAYKKLLINPEEAHTCVLLRSLGKITILLYFPDLYREIGVMTSRGATEELAVWVVLKGISYAKLGMEILRSWNFPDAIVQAMKLDLQKPKGPGDHEGFLTSIAVFCDEFVKAVCQNQNANKLLSYYYDTFKLDKEESLDIFKKSVEEVKSMSSVYRDGLRNLQIQSAINLSTKSAKTGSVTSSSTFTGLDEKITDFWGIKFGISPFKDQSRQMTEKEYDLRPDAINDYIYLLSKKLHENFDLKQFLVLLVAAIQKMIGVDRIQIMHLTKGTNGGRALVGGLGMGDNPAGQRVLFDNDLANSTHIVVKCLKDGQDKIILPEHKKGRLTVNLSNLMRDRKVYLFPLIVSERPAGLLYLDLKAGRPSLSKNQFESIQFCRDITVEAIGQDKKGFKDLMTPRE